MSYQIEDLLGSVIRFAMEKLVSIEEIVNVYNMSIEQHCPPKWMNYLQLYVVKSIQRGSLTFQGMLKIVFNRVMYLMVSYN